MHQCLGKEVTPSQQDPEHGKHKGCSGDRKAMGVPKDLGKWIQNMYFKRNFNSLVKCRCYLKSKPWTDILNSNHVEVKSPDAAVLRCPTLLQGTALLWKMYLFSGDQGLCILIPLQWQSPLCGNPGCICKARELTKLWHLCIHSLVPVYWAQTLCLRPQPWKWRRKCHQFPPAELRLPRGQVPTQPQVLSILTRLLVTPTQTQISFHLECMFASPSQESL